MHDIIYINFTGDDKVKEFGKMLGWISFWGYGIALLNFFMKYINKKYINRIPKDKKSYSDLYRMVMRYVVKYHKMAGIIASIAVLGHLYLMYMTKGLSIPGLTALIVMIVVALLGIYGFFINRNMRGHWLKIHRILSFILIALILFHLLFKNFLII